MAKTFQFDDFTSPQHLNCGACEELLADAIDGVLSPADKGFFDHHLAACAGCSERFTAAQRGVAWLDLLKTHRPEPPVELMGRIIAQTSGQSAGEGLILSAVGASAAGAPSAGNLISFPTRPASRFTRFTRLAMEPRFAMTAAMAFFSIALTLNLTGVRLDQLHASNLKPSNLKRTYYEANASAVRYYDNLRLVRVLESRVEDIRQSQADDRLNQSAPVAKPRPQQEEQKKQDVPPGSSRRGDLLPKPTLLRSRFDATAGKALDHVNTTERPDTADGKKFERGLA